MDIRAAQQYIDSMHEEINKIYEKFNTATSSKEYTELDNQLRYLNEQIENEHRYIEDMYNFIYQLHEQDAEHQRYLDDVARQAEEKAIQDLEDRIASLDGEKSKLEKKQGEIDAAYDLYM